MISGGVYSRLKTCLEAAGFRVCREYAGDIRSGTAAETGYTAFVRIGQTELSELTVHGSTSRCAAEVTAEIRLLGAAAGFYGAEKLISMTEALMTDLYFSSDIIIRKLVCGEPEKNMSAGRLEQRVTVTAVTELVKEAEE